MTDMQVMDKMAAANMDIKMCPDVIQTQKAKGGGHVTVGVPEEIHHLLAHQLISGKTTHYVALYIVNKEQFDKIKSGK